jgi:hypothetical protein
VRDVEGAERNLNLRFKVYKASTAAEIDAAFVDMAQSRPDALLIGGDTLFNGSRRQLVALTTRNSLPSIFDVREFAAEGGLMSYGTSQTDAYLQAGLYVGRILRGAAPSDLACPSIDTLRVSNQPRNSEGARPPSAEQVDGPGRRGDRIVCCPAGRLKLAHCEISLRRGHSVADRKWTSRRLYEDTALGSPKLAFTALAWPA